MLMLSSRAAAGRIVALSLASVALGSAALAQSSFVLPHVLERADGTIAAVAWNVKGGQPIVTPYTDAQGRFITAFVPFDMLFSLHGNDEVLRWIADAVNGTGKSASYSMYSLQKGARNGLVVTDLEPEEIEFPECNADSKSPDGLRVKRLAARNNYLVSGSATSAKLASDAAKKQKMWLPSNFSFTLGGLRIRPGRVKPGRVIIQPGDGRPPQTVDDLVFTVPIVEAGPFEEGVQATRDGKPTELAMRLDYLDEDGNVLISIIGTVILVSAAPENLFLSRDDPDAMLQVRSRYVGTVTIVK